MSHIIELILYKEIAMGQAWTKRRYGSRLGKLACPRVNDD